MRASSRSERRIWPPTTSMVLSGSIRRLRTRVSKAPQRHVAHHAAPVAPLEVLGLALCRCPNQRSETVPQVFLLIRLGVRDPSEAVAALARVALLSISPGEIKFA